MKKCINVSFFFKGTSLVNEIRKLSNDSIARLDYLGYSNDQTLMVEYGSQLGSNDGPTYPDGAARSFDYVENSTFISALENKFSKTGSFNHMGCYGALCAEAINQKYGIAARGASQKTNYDPAGGGGRPELEPSGIDKHYPAKQ